MPQSLRAGHSSPRADALPDLPAQEHQIVRKRSGMQDDFSGSSQPPECLNYEPTLSDRPSARQESHGGPPSPDTRVVARKSVSPHPPSPVEPSISSNPFSPDSYNSLNPNASRPPAVNRDPTFDTSAPLTDNIVREDGPIIGDDGREIDPSDHLPTDTWAPEPERKPRKPEVIVRFKHSPRAQTSPSKYSAPRVSFKPQPVDTASYSPDRGEMRQAHASSPGGFAPDSFDHSSPRGRDAFAYPQGHNRTYSTPAGIATPTGSNRVSHRGSVSPTPGSRSPGPRSPGSSSFYESNAGPPIPAKMPVAIPVDQSQYPIQQGNPGMDALSRELNAIDIGSVGSSPGRSSRKHISRDHPSTMGYAV